MLRLSLVNFRCWTDDTFEFPFVPITLLKGETEIGKTTIFEAILWTLYGKLKVAPIGYPKIRTISKLLIRQRLLSPLENTNELINVRVLMERKTNPKEFMLTYESEKCNMLFRNDEAESVVHLLYGKKEVWKFLCYSPQERDNEGNFFTASNNTKFDYLCAVAFSYQTLLPTEAMHTLSNEINKENANINLLDKQITNSEKRLDKFKYTDKHKLYIIPNKRKTTRNDIRDLECIEEEIIRSLENNKINEQRKLKLEEKLSKLICPTMCLPSILKIGTTEAELSNILTLLDRHNSYVRNYDHHRYQHLSSIIPPTYIDYYNLVEFENSYNEGLLICKRYSIAYDTEIIEERKKTLFLALTNSIANENNLREINKLTAEKEQISHQLSRLTLKLPLPVDKKPILIDDTKVAEIQNDIIKLEERLKIAENVIVCPNCKTNLHYSGSTWMCDNISCDDIVNELNILYSSLRSEKQRRQVILKEYEDSVLHHNYLVKENNTYSNNKQRYDCLTAQVDSIVRRLGDIIYVNTGEDIGSMRKEHSELSRVKVVELPNYKSDEVKQYVSLSKIHHKLEDVISKLKSYEIISDFTTIDYSEVHSYFIHIKQLNQYQSNRDDIIAEIKSIPQCVQVADINEIRDKLDELRYSLQISPIIDNYITEKEEYHALFQERKESLKLHTILLSIRNKAQKAEKVKLDEIICLLNENLNTLLPILFKTGMQISISLEKQMLDGRKRRCVDAKLIIDGDKRILYSQLSEGAKCRLKLAFIVSLQSLCKFPFIIFDEILSSLDVDTRLNCLTIIKDFLYNKKSGILNKSVIVTCHDITDGFYNNIINLGNFA